MRNIKFYKKVLIVFLFFVICQMLTNISLAADIESIKSGMTGVTGGDTTVTTGDGVGKIVNTIIGVFQYVGTGISLVTVALVGIRYMLASVEQKAEIKKQAIPILIGAILLFGGVQLAGAIESFSHSVFPTS